MPAFSDVDAALDPDRLAALLDHTADAERGMKHHAAAVLALADGQRRVLDVGCGGGHDLALLAALGAWSVGVDPSARMLARTTSASGAPTVVRAAGERLPFRDGAFDGCRIERVLMHVVEPSAVVTEAVRCLATGAVIVMFEPNWAGLVIRGSDGDERAGWIAGCRHPGVGSDLWRLAEDAGCDVTDRVEELSVWRELAVLERITGGLDAAVAAAVEAGRAAASDAAAWLAEQRDLDGRGTFLAFLPKVMVVARVARPRDA